MDEIEILLKLIHLASQNNEELRIGSTQHNAYYFHIGPEMYYLCGVPDKYSLTEVLIELKAKLKLRELSKHYFEANFIREHLDGCHLPHDEGVCVVSAPQAQAVVTNILNEDKIIHED